MNESWFHLFLVFDFAFYNETLLDAAHLITEFPRVHTDDRGWCGARARCRWVTEQGCEDAFDNLASILLDDIAKGPIFLNIGCQTIWRELLIELRIRR